MPSQKVTQHRGRVYFHFYTQMHTEIERSTKRTPAAWATRPNVNRDHCCLAFVIKRNLVSRSHIAYLHITRRGDGGGMRTATMSKPTGYCCVSGLPDRAIKRRSSASARYCTCTCDRGVFLCNSLFTPCTYEHTSNRQLWIVLVDSCIVDD
jgi:hypothetical protein